MKSADPPMDLIGNLRRIAAGQPGHPGLKAHGRADCSYARLVETVDQTVAQLRRAGIGARSRVGIILPNSPETAVAILSVASCAAAVPMNPAYPENERRRLMAEAGVTHVLALADSPAMQTAADLGLPVLTLRIDPSQPTGCFVIDSPTDRAAAGSRHDVALVLHTSGSTGTPKRVPLSTANLLASARNVAASLELGPTDICLNMMPMFHIGALVDLLLAPLHAGGTVAFADDISIDAFFAGMERFRPTWFQAVPTVMRDIQAALPDRAPGALARLRFIRAVSQPLPAGQQIQMEAEFGVPIIPMFGMTEAAGLITSTPLGRAKPGSVGVPFGTRLRIGDNTGNELPANARGEVLVGGANVMAGYKGADVPREKMFHGKWLRSGDEGYVDDDGYLFLTGRLKDIINRGGEKISPLEIDHLLAELPAVKEAAAFPLPHASLGEEVAVAVVLKPGAALDTAGVSAHLRGKIADFKIPRKVIFLDRLPRVPSGKLDRLALPALAAGLSKGPRTPPQSPLAKTLAQMWRSVLNVPDVAMEDDFFDLGGDSLTAVNFAMMLEERFGREVHAATVFDAPTLREMEAALAAFLQDKGHVEDPDADIIAAVRSMSGHWRGHRATPDSLIVGRNTEGSARPLFWVSQDTLGHEALSAGVDANRPIYGMRSLSGTGAKSSENTRRLARLYVREMMDLQPMGGFLVGGFCQGGVVAFEIARELKAQGREIILLCLQDRFIPEPYDGPVAFFCGKRGSYSPYHLNYSPERGWAKYYSGPISVHVSEGDHDDLYQPVHAQAFVRQLEAELQRAERGELDGIDTAPRLRPLHYEGFDVRVHFRAPRFPRQGSEHDIRLRIENRSRITLEPTKTSGVVVGSRWHFHDRAEPFMRDTALEIEQPIEPGQTLDLVMPVRVPMRGLPVWLNIDLLEDGVGWFAERRNAWSRRLMFPFGVA